MLALLPRWVKAAALLGAPTMIAFYLVWWSTSQLSAQNAELLHLLRPHVTAGEEMKKALYVIVELERVQCVNAARDDDARRRCARAGMSVYTNGDHER